MGAVHCPSEERRFGSESEELPVVELSYSTKHNKQTEAAARKSDLYSLHSTQHNNASR
jgi:hypothetical protein